MAAFGIHISKQTPFGDYKTLEDAIDSIVSKYDFNAYQMFTHGPQSRSKNKYDVGMISSLNKATAFVHSTYSTDGYWGAVDDDIKLNSKVTKAKLQSYFKHIQDQLNATNEICGAGFIIHITRKPITILEAGMKLLHDNIKQPLNVKIILEFRAMKPSPDSSYETPKQINELASALRPIKLNWGFCLDTSHMWATGVPMGDPNIVNKWFDNITCGDKIALFHLNASSNDTFGKGKDVHIIPFAQHDDMWGQLTKAKKYDDLSNKDYTLIKRSALGFLLLWAKKNKVPIIGEFKRGTVTELQFAIDVIQSILENN